MNKMILIKRYKTMFLISKSRVEQKRKCYRCGHLTVENEKYCPNCLEDGFKIRMLQVMERDTLYTGTL